MIRRRLRALLPLSNRLRWRVIAGLTVVALLAVSGVAAVSYVLAAQGERATARQAALAEAAVLHRVVAGRPDILQSLDDILAPATQVDAVVIDAAGQQQASTSDLERDDLPAALPTQGVAVPATIDGRQVLLTSTALPEGQRLVLVFDQVDTRESIMALRRAVLVAACLMVVILLAVMAAIARRILDPVERTAQAAHRLAQGALGTRLGDDTPHLFADLTGAFDEMAAALEQTVHDLRDIERQQRQFVADVSHELRTPLQALSTAADLLEPGLEQLDGTPRRAAEALVQEVQRLRRMVEDLMEISRLDAGHPDVALEPVGALGLVRRLLGHRGWTDRVDVDVPDDLTVITDPRRLDTILANLVGNALTHGQPPVQIRARLTDEASVVFAVIDAGPGIAADDRDRIFDRFAKADRARTRQSGSGLGLAIAREQAATLDASLTIECPRTGGTIFRVTHPHRHDA